jgi:hypothetical protein
MELTVTFEGKPPSWESILAHWTQACTPIIIRMIDGLPAFPDENPSDNWKEVRVSTSAGMLTLRQATNHIAIVVWGNADPELTRHWKIAAWATAAAGDGKILSGKGSETKEEFLRSEKLFEV